MLGDKHVLIAGHTESLGATDSARERSWRDHPDDQSAAGAMRVLTIYLFILDIFVKVSRMKRFWYTQTG